MSLLKKIFFFLILFSNQILHAETIKSDNTTSPLVAVGQIGLSSLAEPLIVTSNNGGRQWSYVPIPEEMGSLASVACHDDQCTAIGTTVSSSPLIYSSDNPKHSWQENKNISGLPSNLNQTDLASLSCADNICVAVGRYNTWQQNTLLPLILRSEDNGKNWQFIESPSFLPPTGILYQNLVVSCARTHCAIVGNVLRTDDYTFPVVLTSQDSGRSWKFIEKINDFPEKQENGLANVNCDGSNCVAVGMEMNLMKQEVKPLFIYSHDEGKTWNYSSQIDGLAQRKTTTDMIVTTINCSGTFCIAGGIGNYRENQKNTPLLLTSKDSGTSWTQATVTLRGDEKSSINSAHCEGSSCIAIGGSPSHLIISQNQGLSWQTIESISGHPYLMQTSTLNSLSCKKNECAIVGTRWDMGVYHPFFLLSHDHGITWQLSENITGLPHAAPVLFLTNLSGARGDIPKDFLGLTSFKSVSFNRAG